MRRNPRGAGWLLVVVGAVIFELGVFDMHVFRLFEIDHMLYGAVGRSSTSRRSSTPLVTVSSTPPVTT
jgi:hypothetical protein